MVRDLPGVGAEEEEMRNFVRTCYAYIACRAHMMYLLICREPMNIVH
jgi:hypothetical protein